MGYFSDILRTAGNFLSRKWGEVKLFEWNSEFSLVTSYFTILPKFSMTLVQLWNYKNEKFFPKLFIYLLHIGNRNSFGSRLRNMHKQRCVLPDTMLKIIENYEIQNIYEYLGNSKISLYFEIINRILKERIFVWVV